MVPMGGLMKMLLLTGVKWHLVNYKLLTIRAETISQLDDLRKITSNDLNELILQTF